MFSENVCNLKVVSYLHHIKIQVWTNM